MYQLKNTQTQETTILNSDGEFIKFFRDIAEKIGDYSSQITCLFEAKQYQNKLQVFVSL